MSETISKKRKSAFDAIVSRNVAAILMTFITVTVMIPGMTTYLPFQLADQIAVPILLFPFIWTALFVYCYMAKRVWHAWALLGLLILSHAVMSYLALSSGA